MSLRQNFYLARQSEHWGRTIDSSCSNRIRFYVNPKNLSSGNAETTEAPHTVAAGELSWTQCTIWKTMLEMVNYI